MTLIGIDLGTTNCKAAAFTEDGRSIRFASRSTPLSYNEKGAPRYLPDTLWRVVVELLHEILLPLESKTITAIGITSMAETGLLIDRSRGTVRTPLLPWFDTAASGEAAMLEQGGSSTERFSRFGIYPSFKCGTSKLLWLRAHCPESLAPGAAWLSAADFIAWRLTSAVATDYSLAGRTYAFNLGTRQWDEEWLASFGLTPSLFPDALPAGTVIGTTNEAAASALGIPTGIPVVIGGHDHVCAAFGAAVTKPGEALDSMGTAEVLIGAMDHRPLSTQELECGLTFGYLPGKDRMYWLGGLAASGGSVEWLRGILGDPALSYDALQQLTRGRKQSPGTALYFPYLSGCGAPTPNPNARGAFIGLSAALSRTDLVQAILEGTAYQMESIRRAAEALMGTPVTRIVAAGGGTRNGEWLKTKANIFGATLHVHSNREAALLGAALLAGVGTGVYETIADAAGVVARGLETIPSDRHLHCSYRQTFERDFLHWQAVLVSKR